jgi:hypothetical protein
MATRQVGTENIHSSYELNDILNQTQSTSRGGGFRRVLGAIAGGVGNMVLPGVGGLIGGLIGGAGGFGGLGASGGLGEETLQFLRLQQQIQRELRAFEFAVSVLKNRHDSSMSAIRAAGGR